VGGCRRRTWDEAENLTAAIPLSPVPCQAPWKRMRQLLRRLDDFPPRASNATAFQQTTCSRRTLFGALPMARPTLHRHPLAPKVMVVQKVLACTAHRMRDRQNDESIRTVR